MRVEKNITFASNPINIKQKHMKKILTLLGVVLLVANNGFAQTDVSKPIVQQPVYFDVSPPLRDMVKSMPPKADNSWKDGIVKNHLYPNGQPTGDLDNLPSNDPNVQRWFGKGVADTTIANFDGNTNTQGFYPPDTHGEVGRNHYFQVVNCHFSIYDKTGTRVMGPTSNNVMWLGMPNNSNDGDAIILYDEVADRWMFSQFSLPNYPNGPFYQMIAVSQTNDPTGSWNRYQYSYTMMGDYPKFGVWPDGYYMTINRFSAGSSQYSGTAVVAYERSKMLNGQTAQSVMFTLPAANEAWAMLPSDCDGEFPPVGTPNYITYQTNGHIRIYEFLVDWTNTSNSTYTQTVTLPVNSYNGSLGGIHQMGTSVTLDVLPGRLMTRLPFRKFADHWSMAACGTVNVGSSVGGVRWYELRNTGSGWSVYQQGTFSPDNNSRWMGSIAMDSLGNMALGYSISSSSMYPSIRYTGRMECDPLGEMTLGEHGIINGSGYQNYGGGSPQRWGDYSDMCVDRFAPSTFWYTQEYYSSSGGAGWKTRIASFSFASIFCVTATATPSVICAGEPCQLNANTTGGVGPFTYSWTSIPAGFTSGLQNPVVNPTITTQYIASVSDGTATKTDTTTVTVNSEPTANAGPDLTYPNTTPLFPLSGSALFYSSVKWFTSGDGHYNNDTILAPLYYTGPNDKHNGGVDLTLQAFPIGTCSVIDSDTLHVTLTFPTGIAGNSTTVFGVDLSPNPASDAFNLIIHGAMNTGTRIMITDLAGKVIYRDNVIPASPEMSERIDLTGMHKGIYLIKVQTDVQSITKKLVVQ
jgi:hypothetical protein